MSNKTKASFTPGPRRIDNIYRGGLIGCAPEMYEMLEKLAVELDDSVFGNASEEIIKLLAKARGENSDARGESHA